MNDSITAILTVYKRPFTLRRQLKALVLQDIKINEILVWINEDSSNINLKIPDDIITTRCSKNLKFHARFAYALLAKSKYIAFLDDDIIPGENWASNSLRIIKNNRGILGGTGVRLPGPYYTSDPKNKFGWNVPNDKLEQVDLVGHTWFIEKDWLKYMWYEEPISWDNGEDIQFSYLCQKYGNLNTYVTPHPENNKKIWSNIAGASIGNDNNATWLHTKDHKQIRDDVVKIAIDNGWKPIFTYD